MCSSPLFPTAFARPGTVERTRSRSPVDRKLLFCRAILLCEYARLQAESRPIQDEPEEMRKLVYDWDIQVMMTDMQLQTI